MPGQTPTMTKTRFYRAQANGCLFRSQEKDAVADAIEASKTTPYGRIVEVVEASIAHPLSYDELLLAYVNVEEYQKTQIKVLSGYHLGSPVLGWPTTTVTKTAPKQETPADA